MKKKILSVGISFAICLSLVPIPALGAQTGLKTQPGILAASESRSQAGEFIVHVPKNVKPPEVETVQMVTDSSTDVTWGTPDKTHWYAVTGNPVEISERITVADRSHINLILTDGSQLDAQKGITVPKGSSLTIWSGPDGTGVMNAYSTDSCAAIGDASSGSYGGLTINGGVISAVSTGDGAAIGCSGKSSHSPCDAITMNDGTLRGESTKSSGIYSYGDLIVNSGEITGQFTGSESGYGINCGGAVTVSGGTVTGSYTYHGAEQIPDGVHGNGIRVQGALTTENCSVTGTTSGSGSGICVLGDMVVRAGSQIHGTGSGSKMIDEGTDTPHEGAGIYVDTYSGGLEVSGGTVSGAVAEESTFGTGILANLTMSGGEVHGTGGSGISALMGVMVSGGTLEGTGRDSSGGADIWGGQVLSISGGTVKGTGTKSLSAERLVLSGGTVKGNLNATGAQGVQPEDCFSTDDNSSNPGSAWVTSDTAIIVPIGDTYGTVELANYSGFFTVGKRTEVCGPQRLTGQGKTYTLEEDSELAVSGTLTVEPGVTLFNKGTISGTGHIEGSGSFLTTATALSEGNLSVPENLSYTGSALEVNTALTQSFCGQPFTITGWTRSIEQDGEPISSVLEPGKYTVVYTKDGSGSPDTVSRSFTVSKAAAPDPTSQTVYHQPGTKGSQSTKLAPGDMPSDAGSVGYELGPDIVDPSGILTPDSCSITGDTLSYTLSGLGREGDQAELTVTVTSSHYDDATMKVLVDLTAVPVYTVTFMDWDGTVLSQQSVEQGTAASAPSAPMREGYTFQNWDLDFSHVTSALEVRAVYAANRYSVIFDPQGGSTVPAITQNYGGKISAPRVPTRAGYIFEGWYTTPEGGGQAYIFDTMPLDGVVLYAKWTADAAEPDPVEKPEPSNPSEGSSGGSGSGPSRTETMTRPDGSKTTREEKSDGTVVETTKNTDGSTVKTETREDGSSRTEAKLKNGTQAVTEKTPEGIIKAEVKVSKTALEQTAAGPVELPIEPVSSVPAAEENRAPAAAPVVKIELANTEKPVTVLVPLEAPSPAMVAILVHEDGSEEIIRKSAIGEDGIKLTVTDSVTVKLAENTKTFDDVPEHHWANDSIEYVTARGIYNGTGPDQFSPDEPMSRGMLAVVLHNLENNPSGKPAHFSDVQPDKWYSDAIGWASENGIVTGSGSGFSPDTAVTREQLAVMLWRYSGSPKPQDSDLPFEDAGTVSDWAVYAMQWAVESGIINGMEGTLNPHGTAVRAQVASVITRLLCK